MQLLLGIWFSWRTEDDVGLNWAGVNYAPVVHSGCLVVTVNYCL